ncbi:hypothetical protein PCYB_007770, partial [Plasmodium cynomolgi strain B]
YYNYDDYYFLNKIFEIYLDTQDISSVNTDNAIIKSIDSNIKISFINLCATIKDYLLRSRINPLSGVTNPCNYINYYLRKELRKSDYSDKDGTFNNFKEYFKLDDEIKNNSCISQMEYIDNVTFEKMNKLYGLYDAYKNFCYNKYFILVQENCIALSEVINRYNDIINNNEYANSIYLYKELKNIKRLIERDRLFYSGKCDSILSKFTSPEGDALECEKII